MNSSRFLFGIAAMITVVFLYSGSVTAAKLTINIESATPLTPSELAAPNAALVKFELPDKLAGARIDLAKITIEVGLNAELAKPIGVMVCPVMQSWTPTPAGMSGADIVHDDTVCTALFLRGDDDQVLDLNITEYIQSWVNGESQNNGLILKTMGPENAAMSLEQPLGLPAGATAQVTVYYTAPEKKLESK